MKAASILLALVVVLGFVREAGAGPISTTLDCTIKMGDQCFGFTDNWINPVPFFPDATDDGRNHRFEDGLFTTMYLGPFGSRTVPFTATQGLIVFCCILAILIILPVVLTVRWKKKRVAP